MRKAYGLGVLMLLLAPACTPESLEGFEPTNNGNNTTNNATNNTTNNTTGGTFTPEFVNVTGILTTNCTQAACHGSFASNAFVVPTDQNATPAEMQTALVGKTGVSGAPLIAASNPDGSEIWIRMTLDTTDPKFMPSTKVVLQQAEYDAIENWIAAGAVYTQ
ncbi:MAG: hypothetical protein R3E66_04245 [bacterium]